MQAHKTDEYHSEPSDQTANDLLVPNTREAPCSNKLDCWGNSFRPVVGKNIDYSYNNRPKE